MNIQDTVDPRDMALEIVRLQQQIKSQERLIAILIKSAKLPRPPKRVHEDVAHIQKKIAEIMGTPVSEMTSRSKEHKFAWPRQLAMHFCVRYKVGSTGQISRSFGGRVHSAVVHANRIVHDRTSIERSSEALDYARCAAELIPRFNQMAA